MTAWLRNVVLTLTATVGALCLLVAAACLLLGLRPLVFQSGSMSPEIPAGSLALAEEIDASEIAIGDVVSVIAANGVRVTHRVVSLDASGDSRLLTLRGDANSVPDREVYQVTRADRVVAHVPWLGYAVGFLQGRLGLILIGAGAAVLLWIAFRPGTGHRGPDHREPGHRGSDQREPGHRGPHQRELGRRTARRRAARAALPLVAAALAATQATPTMAWFTDSGTISSGTVATHTVVPPASASCSASQLSATVSWPGDARYDYEIVLRRVSNSAVVSTRQVTGSATSTSYSGLSDFGLVVGAGTVDFQVEIRPYLANATTWRAASVRTYQYVRVFAIVIGASASCTT